MALLLLLVCAAVAAALWKSNWARERRAAERARLALEAFERTDVSGMPSSAEFGERFTRVVAEHFERSADSPFLVALGTAAAGLHVLEDFTLRAPPAPARFDSLDGVKYVEALHARRRKVVDSSVLERFAQTTFEALYPLLAAAPHQRGAGIGFPVTFASSVEDLRALVHEVMLPFLAPQQDGLFEVLRAVLERNLSAASGLAGEPPSPQNRRRLVFPDTYRGTDVVKTYLRGTPLADVFDADVEFTIPDASRFEHMHIVAGTGHGKTQTLQRFILHDLGGDAGLVVIDSQGEMLRKIARLRTDRELIYVDPADLAHPPGLNMFDVSRLAGLPPIKREQFLNGLIELLEYVFAGLLRAELTQKQNVLFRYTLRLMLATPGATILDLLRCLADPRPYLTHAEALNPMAREFIEREFLDRSYAATREQIRRRLYGVLENDAFRRMFSAEQNSVHLGSALERGAVVLVDTAKAHLKTEASALMGRYFIALTLQAALEREGASRPAYLYIDEAGEYFDDNIDSLLNEARKRRVGIVMAHQYLDQLSPQLRSSIATNTAIKLAGGVSDKDARALASDMRTTPERITAQPRGHFMCFVRNVTPAAVSLGVPFGQMEALPRRPRLLGVSPETTPQEPSTLGTADPAQPEEPPRRHGKAPDRPTTADHPAPSTEEISPTPDW